MSAAPVLIITGANRGVGLGIVNLITASKTAYTLHITSTSGKDLATAPSGSTYHHHALDISEAEAVKAFANEVGKAHDGKIDAVINNAGRNLNPDGYSKEIVMKTLATNLYGTWQMCDAFLPLLKKGGRLVNVASVAAHLSGYSTDAKAKIEKSATSMSAFNHALDEYLALLEKGEEGEVGYKQDAYCISKAWTVALTKALAAENPDYFINSCCPGWVNTDMGHQMGKPPKSIDDGGKIPLRMAVGDIHNATGEFWENPSISSTADGQISTW